jgi:putative transposase
MWTDENRPKYNRDQLRYPSDLTDEEWEIIEPMVPPARRGGGKRTVDMREVMNSIMYILSTGCQWRYLPKDLLPRSTVFDYFSLWSRNGTLNEMHQALYVLCRKKEERKEEPTACIIDSQSVKSAEKGGLIIDPHGFDAGKKIKGKKRHLLVDTTGLLLIAIVHSASIQDRDGGILLMSAILAASFPYLKHLIADGGYGGPIFQTALKKLLPRLEIEIIRRSDQAKGFVLLPNAGLSKGQSRG